MLNIKVIMEASMLENDIAYKSRPISLFVGLLDGISLKLKYWWKEGEQS